VSCATGGIAVSSTAHGSGEVYPQKKTKVDEFVDIAKDKWKSRSLQRSLMESDQEVSKLIFEKAEPIFTQLLSDQYGNYLYLFKL